MTQPTSLFLADILEDAGKPADIAEKCAAELRRLQAENERLHQINMSHEMKLSVRGYEIQIADLEAQRDALLKALNAMLTHMGMDEDEWNKPTFDQARAALAEPVQDTGVKLKPVFYAPRRLDDEEIEAIVGKPVQEPPCATRECMPSQCPNCASLEAQNTELDRKLADIEQTSLELCNVCGSTIGTLTATAARWNHTADSPEPSRPRMG